METDDRKTSEESGKIRDFLEPGSEIAAGVTATAIGFLAAGPPGAFLGAALGPVVTRVYKRTCLGLYDLATGRGGKVRGGAAVAYALTAIEHRIKNGDSVRDDGFFDTGVRRSPADEVLEAVFIKCRDEHQESKIRYYGNILATAAFDPAVSSESLSAMLVLAERLTYRQMCVLHLFSEPNPDLRAQYGCSYKFPAGQETLNVVGEIFDLYQMGLLWRPWQTSNDDEDFLGGDRTAIMHMGDMHPSEMRLTPRGKVLHNLMQLHTIPDEDIERTVSCLRA